VNWSSLRLYIIEPINKCKRGVSTLWQKFLSLFDTPVSKNKVDRAIMDSLPTMESEIDPDDLSMENAYKTRWIWYHTILAVLIFFTNLLLFGIFILLAIKL